MINGLVSEDCMPLHAICANVNLSAKYFDIASHRTFEFGNGQPARWLTWFINLEFRLEIFRVQMDSSEKTVCGDMQCARMRS